MGHSCGEIILFVIVGIAALNLLVAAFGWSSLSKGNYTINSDPTEDLHLALENLRHELRMVHKTALLSNTSLTKQTHGTSPVLVHMPAPANSTNAKTAQLAPIRPPESRTLKTVVIFTMDSISSYEKNSLSGGASGEMLAQIWTLRTIVTFFSLKFSWYR